MMCRVLAVFNIIAQQLKEDIIGNLYAFYSYNLYRTTFFRLFLYLPNIFDAVQGRILGGGGGGTPKLHKEGKNDACVHWN